MDAESLVDLGIILTQVLLLLLGLAGEAYAYAKDKRGWMIGAFLVVAFVTCTFGFETFPSSVHSNGVGDSFGTIGLLFILMGLAAGFVLLLIGCLGSGDGSARYRMMSLGLVVLCAVPVLVNGIGTVADQLAGAMQQGRDKKLVALLKSGSDEEVLAFIARNRENGRYWAREVLASGRKAAIDAIVRNDDPLIYVVNYCPAPAPETLTYLMQRISPVRARVLIEDYLRRDDSVGCKEWRAEAMIVAFVSRPDLTELCGSDGKGEAKPSLIEIAAMWKKGEAETVLRKACAARPQNGVR